MLGTVRIGAIAAVRGPDVAEAHGVAHVTLGANPEKAVVRSVPVLPGNTALLECCTHHRAGFSEAPPPFMATTFGWYALK